MSQQIRIGVVGLGAIAQKAYLPVLANACNWLLIGAFSPNQAKAASICGQYRMQNFTSLSALAEACDAVFVHSSTVTHFEVVSELLLKGVHVYVDKPLAETLSQSERLIELAARQQRYLMVGFNRRFAPYYQQMKRLTDENVLSSCRLEKHRTDNIGPATAAFTLQDDYLHLIDTLFWLAKGHMDEIHGIIRINAQGQLVYAEHIFSANEVLFSCSMHRKAGTQRETLSAVMEGGVHQIDEMKYWKREQNGELNIISLPSWQNILEQRGFTGAILHFLHCIDQGMQPLTSGEQAIAAQRMIQSWIEKDSRLL